MTPYTEILTNNPTHPCSFCGEPVCITKTYCGVVCETRDEAIKTVLNATEKMENYEAAFNPNV